MAANLENSAVATGLETVSFHSNPKERQCQRMLKLLHNLTLYLKCVNKYRRENETLTISETSRNWETLQLNWTRGESWLWNYLTVWCWIMHSNSMVFGFPLYELLLFILPSSWWSIYLFFSHSWSLVCTAQIDARTNGQRQPFALLLHFQRNIYTLLLVLLFFKKINFILECSWLAMLW